MTLKAYGFNSLFLFQVFFFPSKSKFFADSCKFFVQLWSELAYETIHWNAVINLSFSFYNSLTWKMSSMNKELGEAWFGCQTEIKHLKALLNLKEAHILTLKKYMRTLARREITRLQREKTKREAEKNGIICPVKTLIYDNMIGDINLLCAHCQRWEEGKRRLKVVTWKHCNKWRLPWDQYFSLSLL